MPKKRVGQRGSELTLRSASGAIVTIQVTPELKMTMAGVLIRKREAEGDLDRLVNKGCDRARLLVDLGNLLFDPADLDTWEGLIGYDREGTRKALGTVRDAATAIDRIQRSLIGKCMVRKWMVQYPEFREFSVLPERLRFFADSWELISKEAKPRKNLAATTIIWQLVQHVIEKTGRPRDREVSALISAIRNKPYDENAHRIWRNKYMRQHRQA